MEPKCPPHHWDVNKQQHGVCRDCLAEKDFPREGDPALYGRNYQSRLTKAKPRGNVRKEDMDA